MTPLAVGPVICILGVVAAYFALRTKANSKKSVYRKLRDAREEQIRAARDRAQHAKERQIQAERERAEKEAKAAQQAAAATATAPPEPSARASLPELEPAPIEPAPLEPTLKSEPAQAVWDTTGREAPQEPAYKPAEPAYSPPEPDPVETREPEPVAAAQEVPEPVAATQQVAEAPAGGAGQASWEIVTPAKKEEAEPAAAARPDGGHAEWEIAGADPEPATDKKKSKRSRRESEDVSGEKVAEGPLQMALSYAGLVAALAIILLGIVFMIGSKATG